MLLLCVFFSTVNKHKPWIETTYHGIVTENDDKVLLDPPLIALDKDAPLRYAGERTDPSSLDLLLYIQCLSSALSVSFSAVSYQLVPTSHTHSYLCLHVGDPPPPLLLSLRPLPSCLQDTVTFSVVCLRITIIWITRHRYFEDLLQVCPSDQPHTTRPWQYFGARLYCCHLEPSCFQHWCHFQQCHFTSISKSPSPCFYFGNPLWGCSPTPPNLY